MEKYRKLLFLLVALPLLLTQCKLIAIPEDAQPIVVSIQQVMEGSATGQAAYSSESVIDVSQLLSDAGVDPNNIVEVNLINVQVLITENRTGDQTETDGTIMVGNAADGTPNQLLASFPMTNLNSILNVPVNPFAVGAQLLTLDLTGVQSLKVLLNQRPPVSIIFGITGTANQPPIDFSYHIIVDFQVSYLEN